MSSRVRREIRRSSTAGAAGVGAVIDVGSESFVIPGTGQWNLRLLQPIEMPRLSGRLGRVLKGPTDEGAELKVHRFPKALFCERCRRIEERWSPALESEDKGPVCPVAGCGGRMVPMRFVAACPRGHLDDVDWRFWAHTGGSPSCGRGPGNLLFDVDESGRGAAGLGSLRIRCRCGSSRSLEDLGNTGLVKSVFRCTGRHPWAYGREQCDADVVVLQRGATNLHYPSALSALDIPALEGRDDGAAAFAAQVRGHQRFGKLVGHVRAGPASEELAQTFAELIGAQIGCSTTIVLEVARADIEGRDLETPGRPPGPPEGVDQAMLLQEEWQTMQAALDAGALSSATFEAVREPLAAGAPVWLRDAVSGVLLLRRLREVRAYLGFQRVTPGSGDTTVPPDAGGPQQPWLPAAEVFGEGILIAFDATRLAAWAAALPAREREGLEALEAHRIDEEFWFLPEVKPVTVLLHTLSHLLLRRLTFECGYSSSSLRERLYVSPEGTHAAVMIYTADGDSEGSLGGLVRQGRSDRLVDSVMEAIDAGRWCSSDPVCEETAGQGLGGFNRAACHACSLVAETSCTWANTLLDRRLLYAPGWGLIDFLQGTA